MPRVEGREGRGKRTEASTSLTRSNECGKARDPRCIVLVGRGFALREWLTTLLLASRPMWRGQPYTSPVVRSSTASWRQHSSGAD
jgi:hypothetical protein